MTDNNTSNSYVISAVSQALKVLETLTTAKSMGVTELAKKLSVQKNYAFRVLMTLKEAGFVWQDPETERYSLTSKLHNLSGNASLKNSERVTELANKILQITGSQTSTDRVEVVVETPSTNDTDSSTGETVANSIGD